MRAIFLLLDEVLLVAAMVRLKDDLLWRAIPVVGDIKKAAVIIKELALPLVYFEILPHDDDSVILVTLDRAIGKFGYVLLGKANVLVFTLLHNLLLDIFGRRRGSVFT